MRNLFRDFVRIQDINTPLGISKSKGTCYSK